MSMIRLQEVAARTDLSAVEFTVAIKLAYHENSETGECYPSIRLIEKESGLSHPTIVKTIQSLVKKKIIEKRIIRDSKKNPHSHYSFVSTVVKEINHPVVKEVNHPVVKSVNMGGKTDLPPVVKEINRNQEIESRIESRNTTTPTPPPTGGCGGGCVSNLPPDIEYPTSFQQVKDFIEHDIDAPESFNWNPVQTKFNTLVADSWNAKRGQQVRNWKQYFASIASFQISEIRKREAKEAEERRNREESERRMAYGLTYEIEEV